LLISLALPREAPKSKVFSSLSGNLGNSAGTGSQSVSTAIPKQSHTKARRSVNLTIDVMQSANCVNPIKIILLPSKGCGRPIAAKWKAFSSSAVASSTPVEANNPEITPKRVLGAFPDALEDDPSRWSVSLSGEAPAFESREFASVVSAQMRSAA
jgi:hypothetical protein